MFYGICFGPASHRKTNFMKHLNPTLGVACMLLLMITKPSFSQAVPDNSPEIKAATYSLTVRGVVKEESGKVLPGVSIYLKGTTIGTIANDDGTFEFPRKLEPGDRLSFSYIGFVSQEYLVQGSVDENISIVMTEDTLIITGDAADNDVYSKQSGFRRLWSSVKKVF